jgi:hypothetical protein
MKLPMTFPPLAGLDDEVAVTFPPLAGLDDEAAVTFPPLAGVARSAGGGPHPVKNAAVKTL